MKLRIDRMYKKAMKSIPDQVVVWISRQQLEERAGFSLISVPEICEFKREMIRKHGESKGCINVTIEKHFMSYPHNVKITAEYRSYDD